LVERGYPKKFGAGLIGAGGTLASIIPPSSILILYAATAETSVTNMFTAGIVPGVTVGLILILYVWFMARRNHWDETKEPFSWREVGKATKDAIWALIMPVAILGVIYAGVCTATEAAAVSVIYAALVCKFIYRDIGWKDLVTIFVDSVKTSAFIFAITMTASLFSFLITMERLPQTILNLVLSVNMSKAIFLVLFNLVLFALGFFMTPGPIILIVIPVVLPVAQSLGINPVHMGIMATLNMQLALITPPVGTNIYVMSSVGKMSVQDSIRGLMPFVIILLIALVVISAVPWFSLCLVH
ncbi:MAG: TRAP transporter large permease, partial [Oscillospiraceae bacterium]|nr:TRAP transporter large permease [Oscillospiraceae bacterium]